MRQVAGIRKVGFDGMLEAHTKGASLPSPLEGKVTDAVSTWMVVEDEPDIYEVLLAMFEMWGIEGVAFVDGEEAVAWIDDVDSGRFKGELPELALLDIKLPGDIDGVDVGERLRQSPVLKNMAVVLTTAWKLSPEDQDEAMRRTRSDRWLPKPLPKFNELQGILDSVIAERRKRIANGKAEAGQVDQDNKGDGEDKKKPETEAEPVKQIEVTASSVSKPEVNETEDGNEETT